MADEDTMLYWLAQAAKQAREAADRKQVHVAASADVDQSTIWRFEQPASNWPRNIDRIVAGYADDLDITPIDLWTLALKLWAAYRDGKPAAKDAIELATAEAAQRRDKRSGSSTAAAVARRRAGQRH